MKMQFPANENPTLPERTYGSIKRTNNMQKTKMLEEDVSSLMNAIDNIFEEAHNQSNIN
jgi:hypothetical protein